MPGDDDKPFGFGVSPPHPSDGQEVPPDAWEDMAAHGGTDRQFNILDVLDAGEPEVTGLPKPQRQRWMTHMAQDEINHVLGNYLKVKQYPLNYDCGAMMKYLVQQCPFDLMWIDPYDPEHVDHFRGARQSMLCWGWGMTRKVKRKIENPKSVRGEDGKRASHFIEIQPTQLGRDWVANRVALPKFVLTQSDLKAAATLEHKEGFRLVGHSEKTVRISEVKVPKGHPPL